MSERRKHCRYAFVLTARVLGGAGEQTGTVLDISREGAQLVTTVEARVGTAAFLQLRIDGREAEAIGSVIRIDSHGGAPCYGLHFHAGDEIYVDFVDSLEAMPEAARAHELRRLAGLVLKLGT